MLERAATDPNSDLERLDRLAMLYERMAGREAGTKFNADLVKLQPRLPVLDERAEIYGPDGAVHLGRHGRGHLADPGAARLLADFQAWRRRPDASRRLAGQG